MKDLLLDLFDNSAKPQVNSQPHNSNPQDSKQCLPLLAMLHAGISYQPLAERLHQGMQPSALLNSPSCLPSSVAELVRALSSKSHSAWQQAERSLALMQERNIQLLLPNDPCWPQQLSPLPQAPGWLFVQGQVRVLAKPQLALVGSRHASAAALRRAAQLAEQLAHHGWVVTSGMALGIDAKAHLGAMVQGHTLAVLGSGLANLYPKRHLALAKQIAEQGALISEYPPTEAALNWHFPARNRIISGLAQGVVVVEADLRSGSLITARWALEQGREVMAMPGSPDNPNARGCHQLIKQGAALVNDAEDVLALMGTQLASPLQQEQQPGSALKGLAKLIWQELDEVPISLDALCLRLDRPLAQLLPVILQLQLDGYIAQQGQWLSRA